MEVVVVERAVGKDIPRQGSLFRIFPESRKTDWFSKILLSDQPPGLAWD